MHVSTSACGSRHANGTQFLFLSETFLVFVGGAGNNHLRFNLTKVADSQFLLRFRGGRGELTSWCKHASTALRSFMRFVCACWGVLTLCFTGCLGEQGFGGEDQRLHAYPACVPGVNDVSVLSRRAPEV